MGLFGGLTKTIGGIAKTALGGVSEVRRLMDFNPSLAGLAFPPQVSMGLKAANLVGGLVGIKVPTQDDLIDFAQGKVDSLLGGIRRKIKTPLDDIERIIKGADKLDYATRIFSRTVDLKGLSAEEVLNRIDWLL